MVKLDYLEPFDTYRTKPPVIMPENPSNRKKNKAFIIIAPSIEEELRYLSNNTILKFRNLYKYFIEKRWEYTLYGQGRKIVKLNEDGDISARLQNNKRGNLKNIDGVISYLPTSAVRPLKDLNVLIEVNHVNEFILSNPKDRRLMAYKAKGCLAEYQRLCQSITDNDANYLGKYELSVIIPMNLWFDKSDYSNPNLILKSNTKEFMGQILMAISDPNTLKKFGENTVFYLIHDEIVLPIKYSAIPEDAKPSFIQDQIRHFMTKARNFASDEVEDNVSSDTDIKLRKAEEESKKDAAVDAVLEKSSVDPDTVAPETKEKIKKAVASAKHTEQPVILPKDVPDIEPEFIKVDGTDQDEGIKVENLKIEDPGDVDVLLAAKTTGKSVQSFMRDEKLKEKYKELKIGNVPLTDLINEEKQYAIPETKIPAKTVNDGMKSIKSQNFERTYNENLALKDLTNILLHFSHANPALYIDKDIKVEDVSTPTDRVIRYTVEFEDTNRKRHRFSFKLPKMYKDNYLYLNDQEMNLTHQKLPFPVTKVSPSKCQAVTNYNKIFTERYGSNLSPRITRIKKIFGGLNCPKFARVVKGDATPLNAHTLTTIEYDEIGSSILEMQFGKSVNDITKIIFIADEAAASIDPRAPIIEGEENLLPLAVRTVNKAKTFYYISGTSNKVYSTSKECFGELSDFIITVAGWYDDKIQDLFADVSAGTKFVYSRSTVMAQDIPTILVLGAADPDGLIGVLAKAQIKYTFTDKRPIVNKDEQGVIPFSDGWLIFDRYPYENSLLLNGLNTFPTREFSFYDMGTRDAYVEIFDLMYSRRNLIDGLENFYYMFIDPITMDVLMRLNMPTDFTRLMLYCNDSLADNTFQIDSDYHNTRLRSNEIVYAYLYKELADAWGRYKDGRAEKFSIHEDAIIKQLLTANIVDPHTELNLALETENDRQVKLKGPSGMNEDHSFTLEKRAYHPSMTGVIGMNSTPSGEVGINRHMTLNSNIVDARGFIEINKGEYDGSELATPGELLQTFGPESADIERVAMAISQSKHVVPVASSTACPVSYDMERVIPYLSKDFAFTAKKNGKIEVIENDVMIIKYDDGTYDDVDLAERPAKNTDGGFYIMNQLSTDLKVGARVKEGQLVAYDKKYINSNDLFGDPLANVGTLARIAVETNGGVYEDACYLTDDLAHRMETKITKQKRVILSKFANIKYMVKVGQVVKANDPILTFDDTEDEFSSQLLASMAEEAGDEDEVIATTAPIITKVSGVIRDIRIYYTIPLEEMSPSMRKIVSAYVKDAQKREKTISKYKNIYDANTIVKTSEQLIPDSTGKVKGVKISDGIFIDFYIEYQDIMAPGDKLSFFAALKGIVSDVIPSDLAAYTERNPERKIDACLSCIGVYKRMCADVIKVGMLTKIVVEKKADLKAKYGQRIKDEMKKK